MSATEANGWTIYSALPTRNRKCGACQACCTAVPVELRSTTKPANTRCPHQCSHGCGIYPTRPDPCRYWSCRWLFDDAAGDLKRPDISGYIVDCVTDRLLINGEPFEAMQVWIDPKRRDAHRAPELRAYLQAAAERFGYFAIIRWSNNEGMLLAAPHFTGGEWEEREQAPVSREEVQAQLAAVEKRAEQQNPKATTE